MAFSSGIGDRGALKSPREESSFASIASPLRNAGAQMSSASNDARGHLHRRFTTNNIPTLNTPLSPIGQQRRQAAEPPEFTTAVSELSLPSQHSVKRWIRTQYNFYFYLADVTTFYCSYYAPVINALPTVLVDVSLLFWLLLLLSMPQYGPQVDVKSSFTDACPQ
jgi:hypothetical protein